MSKGTSSPGKLGKKLKPGGSTSTSALAGPGPGVIQEYCVTGRGDDSKPCAIGLLTQVRGGQEKTMALLPKAKTFQEARNGRELGQGPGTVRAVGVSDRSGGARPGKVVISTR